MSGWLHVVSKVCGGGGRSWLPAEILFVTLVRGSRRIIGFITAIAKTPATCISFLFPF